MGPVRLETLASPFQPMFAANKALAALPTIAPQLADPMTGTDGSYAAGVINIGVGNQSNSNYGKFVFFGTGTAAQSFEAKLVGWQLAQMGSPFMLWIPVTIADLTCTLGSTAGAGANAPLTTSQLMVSAITVLNSLIEPNYDLWPADNGIQLIRFDLSGFERLQLLIGPSGGATNGNALFSPF